MTQQEPPPRNHLQPKRLITHQLWGSDILPQGKCTMRSKDVGTVLGGSVEIVEPGFGGVPM